MQLYAVNFIPLLGSLYMFRVFYTPIIRSTILKTVLQPLAQTIVSSQLLTPSVTWYCWLFIDYNMMHGTINIKYNEVFLIKLTQPMF